MKEIYKSVSELMFNETCDFFNIKKNMDNIIHTSALLGS